MKNMYWCRTLSSKGILVNRNPDTFSFQSQGEREHGWICDFAILSGSSYSLIFDPLKLTELEVLASFTNIDSELAEKGVPYMIDPKRHWTYASIQRKNDPKKEIPIGISHSECIFLGELIIGDDPHVIDDFSFMKRIGKAMRKEEEYWGPEIWLANAFEYEWEREITLYGEDSESKRISLLFIPKLATKKELADNKKLLLMMQKKFSFVNKAIKLTD